MAGFLHDRVAVVTGGTRGIGKAIVRALLEEGAAVALCGRTPEAVTGAVGELATHGNVQGQPLDVRDASAVARFFEFVDRAFGGLDILVNNAGVGIFRPVSDLGIEEWRDTLDTNLSGVFYCCREALPRLRHRGGGAIINISSLAGRNPFAGGAAYNASKFALNGFSEAMMLDHRHEGIRVTYVMPGSVDTGFSNRTRSAPWKIAPEDIAELVLTVLRMPPRTTVSRIEVRPSMPPKSGV